MFASISKNDRVRDEQEYNHEADKQHIEGIIFKHAQSHS